MTINHFAKKRLIQLGVWGVICFMSTMLTSGCASTSKALPHLEAQVIDQTQGQGEVQIQAQERNQISSDSQQSLTQSPIESNALSQSQSQPQSQTLSQSASQSPSEPGIKPIAPSQPPLQQSQKKHLKEIPILYYHSIEKEAGNELRIPAEEFESHIKFLHQAGYQSITLHELYQHFYEGRELPQKPFVLTFDDGYSDNYSNAFRIAGKYGFTGTIFMVTGWIDGEGYLTKEQLREMSKAGWQIEAHTVSHPKLNELTAAQLESELRESKRQLEKLLNRPVEFLAYPFGVYTEQVIQESRAAGYLMGLTTERGWAKEKDPYRVQRIYCYADMGVEELKRRLENPNY